MRLMLHCSIIFLLANCKTRSVTNSPEFNRDDSVDSQNGELNVIGGTASNQTKSVVAIVEKINGNYQVVCTGTAVTPTKILTARHCLADSPANAYGIVHPDNATDDLSGIVPEAKIIKATDTQLDAANANIPIGCDNTKPGPQNIPNDSIAVMTLNLAANAAVLTPWTIADIVPRKGQTASIYGYSSNPNGVFAALKNPKFNLLSGTQKICSVGDRTQVIGLVASMAAPSEITSTNVILDSGDSGGPLSTAAGTVFGVSSATITGPIGQAGNPAKYYWGGTSVSMYMNLCGSSFRSVLQTFLPELNLKACGAKLSTSIIIQTPNSKANITGTVNTATAPLLGLSKAENTLYNGGIDYSQESGAMATGDYAEILGPNESITLTATGNQKIPNAPALKVRWMSIAISYMNKCPCDGMVAPTCKVNFADIGPMQGAPVPPGVQPQMGCMAVLSQ